MKTLQGCLISLLVLSSPFLFVIGCVTVNRWRAEGTPTFHVRVDRVTSDGSLQRSERDLPSERTGRIRKRIRGAAPDVEIEVQPFAGKLSARFEYEVIQITGPAVAIGHARVEETLAVLVPDPGRTMIAWGPSWETPGDLLGLAGTWDPFGDGVVAAWMDGPGGALWPAGDRDPSTPPRLEVESESGWLIDFGLGRWVEDSIQVTRRDGSSDGLAFEIADIDRGPDAPRTGSSPFLPRPAWAITVRDRGRLVLTLRFDWPVAIDKPPSVRLVQL